MIRLATKLDLASIEDIYRKIHLNEIAKGPICNWKEGLYPTKKTAEDNILNLYVLQEDNSILGAMILNHSQSPEYKDLMWKYPAEDAKVLVIHTLCTNPQSHGYGHGQKLLDFAIKEAQQTGMSCIRLDTWEHNLPAQKLYIKNRFEFVGKHHVCPYGDEIQIFYYYELNINALK